MEEEILKIKKEAVQQITAATAAELESLHIKFLGRKSLLAQLTARLRELPPAQKPLIGRLINETKRTIEQMLEEKSGALAKAEGEEFDLTLPALPQACGSLHPLTLVAEEIEEVFKNFICNDSSSAAVAAVICWTASFLIFKISSSIASVDKKKT